MTTPVKKVSIKDIAGALGLSITTVSFVINGKSDEKGISPATVKKVKDLIKEKRFNPNSAARMLRTGKSKTIGLIVEDIGNYFFGNIAKIIEIEAHKNGYSVFFSSTENNNEQAKALIHKMKDSSVDGFIITATTGLKDEINALIKEDIPFVLIDRLIPEVDANHVILDNYRGAYELTQHLIGNGYSQTGFISIVSEMSMMADRERGYKDALKHAKIKTKPKATLKVPFEQSNENIIECIKKYILKNPELEALFFATNYLGVLGIEALQQSKIKIPSDLAVVCFDDNDLFRLFTPSITVAAQPIHEIATKAIALLMKIISKEQKKDTVSGEILNPHILIRNSCPPKSQVNGLPIF